jgi:hypothetical protein
LLQHVAAATSKKQLAARKLQDEVRKGSSGSVRLAPQLASLHERIVKLQRDKAIAESQVSALEAMILGVNRSECSVSTPHFSRFFFIFQRFMICVSR